MNCSPETEVENVVMSTPSIELECWINGRDVEDIFLVTLPENDTVETLKVAIKEEVPCMLEHVTAKNLNLYAIPSPSDEELNTVLTQWNPPEGDNLDGRTGRLSMLFQHGQWLIVVDVPVWRNITLNCWVRGHDLNRAFPVKISPAELVGTLREAIKDKKPVDFGHVDASSLVLYKACLPCNGIRGTIESLSRGEEDMLIPVKTLSYYFPKAPLGEHIHVVIEPPLSVARPYVAPSSLHPRVRYVEEFRRLLQPSSEAGEPSNFKYIQSTSAYVEWSRPSVCSLAPPVTLLHSIFGQFVDDCHKLEPTCNDNSIALKLSSQLNNIFIAESWRTETFTEILCDLGIHMISTSSDGDLQVNGRRYVIMKVKNEIGAQDAEPYFQAILCYARGLKVKKIEDFGFNFPCLLVTHIGGHLSFSGAVLSDQVNYQILTTCPPLFFHPNDLAMRKSIARHIGAFRVACENLKGLYEKFDATPSVFANLQPGFPYPRCYTNSSGEKVHFTYQNVLQGSKLLFVVRTALEALCVKFAQTYSTEAHRQCAALGISPRLLGHDVLPGGWLMITMDYLERYDRLADVKNELSGEHKERVRGELRASLTALHRRNLVHGDVRDANVMMTEDRTTWRLIDFEWSGEIGEVRYPMNVNRSWDLRRPEGAKDGELIVADHDIEMLNYLF